LNNAGLVGSHGVTAQGFERTFGTNHLGHFLLTIDLVDLLRAGAKARGAVSRVVDVASQAHVNAKGIDWSTLQAPTASRTGWREYAVSKLCNVLHARAFAKRYGLGDVHAHSLHPGVIASDLWRKVPQPFRALMTLGMKDNVAGAKTSVWCCTAKELEGVSGRYYDDCRERAPTKIAQDDTLADELWTRSEAWVAPFRAA
jgi:NAD(P)-dependent dehydrogenase (short-subunit alcohol dehydrogenase family)